MILDRSTWRPADEKAIVPERRIVRTAAEPPPALPAASPDTGSWPSFRGARASGVAEDQHLPDRWDGRKGQNILWRTPIPGLAHSSPIVWGHRIFVTSAVSSNAQRDVPSRPLRRRRRLGRSIAPALDDLRDRQANGKDRLGARGVRGRAARQAPHQVDLRQRHAGHRRPHRRRLVRIAGRLRLRRRRHTSCWKVDLGRVDMGAYDIPTYEWGPASSPIIWNGLVILQCDTQADSFLLALNAETGETVWKTDREELPSWGTPTVATTSAGPRARDQRVELHPRLRPAHRQGAVAARRQLEDHRADAGLRRRALRRRERPRARAADLRGPPGARGDLTLAAGQTKSDAVAWSRTGRGPYMPTPLIYRACSTCSPTTACSTPTT